MRRIMARNSSVKSSAARLPVQKCQSSITAEDLTEPVWGFCQVFGRLSLFFGVLKSRTADNLTELFTIKSNQDQGSGKIRSTSPNYRL